MKKVDVPVIESGPDHLEALKRAKYLIGKDNLDEFEFTELTALAAVIERYEESQGPALPKIYDSSNYVSAAIRTEPHDLEPIKERLMNHDTIRLLHAAMGMATEAGEFLDMVKKHVFYGKSLDFKNGKEELGDQLWYIALGISVLKENFDAILTGNIEKLRKRYPEKFDENHAINRNTDNELSHL